MTEQPVVVVTGGGNGIGAAIAEELGRQGAHVVTLDPMVTLDGSTDAGDAGPTTAERIVAAGGSARAANISVTDGDAVADLFDGLRDEHKRLDGVINVAGISRPTGFARGTEQDWRSVLDVHLNGYRNILEAALPIMSDARHGRIVGVTSGSGWRAADAGAYSCAKRAVAALTWQLGWQAPPGVVINAISPIAVTRMVTAALGGGAGAGASKATGGLNLGSMPQPEELGPLAAYLVSDDPFWLTGEVIFAGGSEVAIVEPPRLLEVVRTTDAASLPHVLETVGAAFAKAEANQLSGGGSNPRFPGVFEASDPVGPSSVETCAVVSEHLAGILSHHLQEHGVKCVAISDPAELDTAGPFDAVVYAMRNAEESTAATDWERTLEEHAGIVDAIYADAMWSRAVADYAARANRRVRLVTLTEAFVSSGRTRAQAAVQLSRSARKATGDLVASFAVAREGGDRGLFAFVTHLVTSPTAVELSGAELVVGDGWAGVRSHPRPAATLTFGGPAIPDWFDGALRSMVR